MPRQYIFTDLLNKFKLSITKDRPTHSVLIILRILLLKMTQLIKNWKLLTSKLLSVPFAKKILI